jgi:hypothetical protein
MSSSSAYEATPEVRVGHGTEGRLALIETAGVGHLVARQEGVEVAGDLGGPAARWAVTSWAVQPVEALTAPGGTSWRLSRRAVSSRGRSARSKPKGP